MNLCDKNVIQALLKKHDFHFSKSKGQNFLTQYWVPQSIVSEANIDSSCGVLEVGPGIGTLTRPLCESAGKVVSVEIDQRLVPILAETLSEYNNFTLVMNDILKTNISELVAQNFMGLRPVACANLPYYITSPVLSVLLKSGCFEQVTVMVQKEVALRMCAKPGSQDYSAFSLLCQYYAEPEILFDVSPSCFLPQPKVYSTVVTLRCFKASPWGDVDSNLFFNIVKASFSQRRKTLCNALAATFSHMTKEEIIHCIKTSGFSESIRGEKLSVSDFVQLATCFQQYLHGVVSL